MCGNKDLKNSHAESLERLMTKFKLQMQFSHTLKPESKQKGTMVNMTKRNCQLQQKCIAKKNSSSSRIKLPKNYKWKDIAQLMGQQNVFGKTLVSKKHKTLSSSNVQNKNGVKLQTKLFQGLSSSSPQHTSVNNKISLDSRSVTGIDHMSLQNMNQSSLIIANRTYKPKTNTPSNILPGESHTINDKPNQPANSVIDITEISDDDVEFNEEEAVVKSCSVSKYKSLNVHINDTKNGFPSNNKLNNSKILDKSDCDITEVSGNRIENSSKDLTSPLKNDPIILEGKSRDNCNPQFQGPITSKGTNTLPRNKEQLHKIEEKLNNNSHQSSLVNANRTYKPMINTPSHILPGESHPINDKPNQPAISVIDITGISDDDLEFNEEEAVVKSCSGLPSNKKPNNSNTLDKSDCNITEMSGNHIENLTSPVKNDPIILEEKSRDNCTPQLQGPMAIKRTNTLNSHQSPVKITSTNVLKDSSVSDDNPSIPHIDDTNNDFPSNTNPNNSNICDKSDCNITEVGGNVIENSAKNLSIPVGNAITLNKHKEGDCNSQVQDPSVIKRTDTLQNSEKNVNQIMHELNDISDPNICQASMHDIMINETTEKELSQSLNNVDITDSVTSLIMSTTNVPMSLEYLNNLYYNSSLKSMQNSLRTHYCQICSKGCASPRALRQHVFRIHENRIRKPKETSPTCDLCQKTYASRAKMLEHRAKIHSLERFICNDCSTVFNNKYKLTEHIKNNHLPPQFPCLKCSKVFSNRQKLKVHLYSEHLENREKTFMCEVCGKAWKQKFSLEQHMLIHTQEKPFVCEECGKCFRTYTNLSQHSITHSNIRPFTCGICDKSFRIRNHLKQHMVVHGMVSTASNRKRKRLTSSSSSSSDFTSNDG